MAAPRRIVFALLAAALAGCHEDPEVVTIQVFPSGGALGLFCTGGDATGALAVGGPGGALYIGAWEEVSAGESALIPTAPAVPAAPTMGTTLPIIAGPLSTTAVAGTVLISGTVVGDASGTVTITSNGGDIVVSGSLTSGDVVPGPSVPDNITLNAPNGTVYVLGTISTRNTDGTLDGDAGGTVTINAMRIVLTGTIDTRGEDSSLATVGDGGAVTLDTTGFGDILFTSGSILTTGGTGTAPAALTGALGGAVSLQAGSRVSVYGTITADGGAISGTGTVSGGTGGNVTIDANGGVDIVATIASIGGAATGTTGATGGTGGTVLTDSYVLTRVYGSITTRGGTATSGGGAITGGQGGDITLGDYAGGTGALRLEIGRSTYSSSGGSGTEGGGMAGTITLESDNGRVTLGAPLVARGGAATGTVTAPGGNGNTVSLSNFSVYDDDSVFILPTGSIDTSGGTPVAAGLGGSAGDVDITAGADVQILSTISMRGADSPTGTGGQGGALTINASSGAGTSNFVLLQGSIDSRGGGSGGAVGGAAGDVTVNATGGTATRIDSTSAFTCTGGTGAGTGDGGNGGTLIFTSNPGAITFTGTLNTSGGTATGTGAGGAGGPLSFSATDGDLSLAVTLTASGGGGSAAGGGPGTVTCTTAGRGSVFLSGTFNSNAGSTLTGAPAAGGTLSVTAGGTGGSIASSAVITMLGGSPASGAVSPLGGGNGGTILLDATSTSGTVTLAAGSSILLDGGSSNGVALAGAGGSVTINTFDQAISVSGSLLARGGPGLAGGSGGVGGQVLANSDNNNDGLGGGITLETAASIDVSGGAGTLAGGPARNTGMALGFAVNFEAEGGANPSVDAGAEGVVLNNGSITALGGTGLAAGADGEVRFDGTGTATADPVSGPGTVNPLAGFIAD